MGIQTAYVDSMRTSAQLHPSSFTTTREIWEQFFAAIGADYMIAEDAVPATKASLDKEILFVMRTITHEDYTNLYQGLTSALAAWKHIKATFISNDTRSRVRAWQDFIQAEHDIHRPVSVFTANIMALAKRLEEAGYRPTDFQIASTILSNLDPSFSKAKSHIYNEFASLDLLKVRNFIDSCRADDDRNAPELPASQTGAVTVKSEPSAAALRTSAPRRAGGSTTSRPASGEPFRWCSAVHNDQCRRCGRSGHIADRCVADMPDHVKDWVIKGYPRESFETHTAAVAHGAMHATVEDDDGDDDSSSEPGEDVVGPFF